jgi:hypothetical protein
MTDRTATPAAQAPDSEDEPRFYVGSYVLETLTTGMYTEPRDCIREYVQNGLDAIDTARQAKLLAPHEGEIRVIVSAEEGGSITIRDNGASIPAERAWETLTSIGASRKNPRRQAGFRGIGRLAGIAYCNQLEFTCKAAGEDTATTIAYDCSAIKRALREGGLELEPVFRRSISIRKDPTPGKKREHYTEVRLVGTTSAPDELQDVSLLADYLKSVAPVDFLDGWDTASKIKRYAEDAGFAIPIIRLLIGSDPESLDEVRKNYTNATVANKKASPIRKISFFAGDAQWWGWYGELPLYGAINDPNVAGIRIRVKNIQLDGAEIIARILQKHAPSYARFASWHLGEIYVEGDAAIPNARRDGFEDSAEWRVIEDQIAEALRPLVTDAYDASGKRSSKDFKRVSEDTRREIQEIQTAISAKQEGPTSFDRKALARKIRGALRRIENLNIDTYTDAQQRNLREAALQLRELAAKASVSVTPARPKPEPDSDAVEIPYREFLDIVFEVLSPLLDTRTFNKVRKALIERFKDA